MQCQRSSLQDNQWCMTIRTESSHHAMKDLRLLIWKKRYCLFLSRKKYENIEVIFRGHDLQNCGGLIWSNVLIKLHHYI